jgi:hypothetical protein
MSSTPAAPNSDRVVRDVTSHVYRPLIEAFTASRTDDAFREARCHGHCGADRTCLIPMDLKLQGARVRRTHSVEASNVYNTAAGWN